MAPRWSRPAYRCGLYLDLRGKNHGRCCRVEIGLRRRRQLADASGRYRLAYDERNRTSPITPSGGSVQTQTYAGTGQGERLSSGATTFLNDQLGIGWANVTAVGSGDALAAGKTYFTRAPGGSLISQRKPDGTTEYIILDGHPGSVVALVDASKSSPPAWSRPASAMTPTAT